MNFTNNFIENLMKYKIQRNMFQCKDFQNFQPKYAVDIYPAFNLLIKVFCFFKSTLLVY